MCSGNPVHGARRVITELVHSINYVTKRRARPAAATDGKEKPEENIPVLQLLSLTGILAMIYSVRSQRRRFCTAMVECGVVPSLLRVLHWVDFVSPPAGARVGWFSPPTAE